MVLTSRMSQDRRFDSDFRTARYLISEGALGTVLEAEIHFDFPSPSWVAGWTQKEYTPGRGMAFGLGEHGLVISPHVLNYSPLLPLTLPVRHPHDRPSSLLVWTASISDGISPLQPRRGKRRRRHLHHHFSVFRRAAKPDSDHQDCYRDSHEGPAEILCARNEGDLPQGNLKQLAHSVRSTTVVADMLGRLVP